MIIPDGDWFCPPCDHRKLCEKLMEELKLYDTLSKKRDREELRKQRLAYVGISLDNVLKPRAATGGKKRKRARKLTSLDFTSEEEGDDETDEYQGSSASQSEASASSAMSDGPPSSGSDWQASSRCRRRGGAAPSRKKGRLPALAIVEMTS
ncbi:hypothetical protein MRX96_019392 [Rhipicephalus microplus]